MFTLCIFSLLQSLTLGNHLFKAPDKIAFEQALDADISKEGDSHNPDDPHFSQLKISTLKKYASIPCSSCPSITVLVMREGERISSEIFGSRFDKLIETYKAQNALSTVPGFIDPYLSIRNISMPICGVDLDTFSAFQKQTEQYRFDKTTLVNRIHLTQITYNNDRNQKVAQTNWQQMPPFRFAPVTLSGAVANGKWSLLSMLSWVFAGFVTLKLSSKTRKYQL